MNLCIPEANLALIKYGAKILSNVTLQGEIKALCDEWSRKDQGWTG